MNETELRAYAKINLSLTVTGRRENGYHNIRSLMQGIGLFDVIKLTKCPRNATKYKLPHCTIGGVVVYLCTDAETIPVDMSNLAFRGAAAVIDAYERQIQDDLMISIDKRLPVAAGIAGGSGNAAVCMLGLNSLLGSPFSLRELMDIGVSVGADVPFSLLMNAKCNADSLGGLRGAEEASTAAWIGGIGEIVEPADPLCRYVILTNPGIAVSTRAAYEGIDAIMSEPGYQKIVDEYPLFVNDLESYTLRDYPEAAHLKSVMQQELNADKVLMSGSGPTMAAYYEDEEQALSDFARMKELAAENDGWRTWFTATGIGCVQNEDINN